MDGFEIVDFPKEKDTAQKFGMSPACFSSKYKRKYGISYKKSIQSLKVKIAKTYLTVEDLSMKEISDLLGFSQPSHFSYWFKKETGLKPSEYRRNVFRPQQQ